MTTQSTSNPPQPVGPVSYELMFIGEYGAEEVEADLTSPLLDPVLHPTGTLRVVINTDTSGKKAKPKFLLDSFHVDSLTEYLRSQPLVRSVPEAELPKNRREWEVEGETKSSGLWAVARVLRLELRRRNLPDPETVATLRRVFRPEEAEFQLAAMDTPHTRTAFKIVMDCDWHDDHQFTLECRDGEFETGVE